MSLSYFVVILGTVISKIFGFLRDIFFADAFGTTAESDIYFGIYGVVTLVFACIGMALSTLIIKNLNMPENASEERKKAYVSFFLKRTSLFLLAATALLYLLAPVFVKLLLPDISNELVPLAKEMTYIMLPSLFFIVVAYIISGVLQNERVFFVPSVISMPYNIILIAAIIFGADVKAVGYAATAGWGCHLLFQLPSFYKKGYRFFASTKKYSFKSSGALEVSSIFISNMMFQLCFLIDKSFVSGDSGMVATVNYASSLFTTVSGIFVIAMSSVIFPAISKNFGEGKEEYIRKLVRYVIIFMFVIFVPYLLTVSVFGGNIISLIYERGEFTAESTAATSTAYIIYSFGILGYIAQELFNKIFYLASKYKFTVTWTAVIVLLKIVMNSAVVERFGSYAAAFTTTLLLTAYAVSAAFALRGVIGKYANAELFKDILKILASGGAALCGCVAFNAFFPSFTESRIGFVFPLAVSAVIYIAVIFASGLPKSLASGIKKVREK